MSIISKESFEKLTEDEKQKLIKRYQSLLTNKKSDTLFSYKSAELADVFGEENLQPKPKIRTWDDVNKMDNRYHRFIDDIIRNGYMSLWNNEAISKVIASLKISKLIELGYGGMVTDNEWKDNTIEKYCIVPCDSKLSKYKIISHVDIGNYHFIAFHTIQQAVNFISYHENVQLISHYYLDVS